MRLADTSILGVADALPCASFATEIHTVVVLQLLLLLLLRRRIIIIKTTTKIILLFILIDYS